MLVCFSRAMNDFQNGAIFAVAYQIVTGATGQAGHTG